MNFDEFVQKECPELCPTPNLPHGLTLPELGAEFGADVDWPKFRKDPRWLQHLAESLHARRLREHGEVPPSYTAVRECEGCGLVFLEPWSPPKAVGCPWCMNRAKGLPIPVPAAASEHNPLQRRRP